MDMYYVADETGNVTVIDHDTSDKLDIWNMAAGTEGRIGLVPGPTTILKNILKQLLWPKM